MTTVNKIEAMVATVGRDYKDEKWICFRDGDNILFYGRTVEDAVNGAYEKWLSRADERAAEVAARNETLEYCGVCV